MGICYVIGASVTTCKLRPEEIENDDCVIAADGGYHTLQEWGVKPDQIVGDFDSLGFIPETEQVVQFPVEKDDTDMMIAVKLGLDQGYRHFLLYGGLGGRLDHTIANLHILSYLSEHGARGCLVGDNENVTLIKNAELTFEADAADTVSVFAYGGSAEGVYLTNLKYPLKNAVLTPEFPLGVSNEFTGERAGISVRNGKLLVCWTGSRDVCRWY